MSNFLNTLGFQEFFGAKNNSKDYYVNKDLKKSIDKILNYKIKDVGIGYSMREPSFKMFPFYTAETTNPFSDVSEDHWAFYSIIQCRDLGLVSGVGDNKFDPDRVVTRAEIVQVLYSICGKYYHNNSFDLTNNNTIKDVNDNDWYANAVQWAIANKIVSLDQNNQFKPNGPATRGFTCLSLYNMAKRFIIGLPNWLYEKEFYDVQKSSNEQLAKAVKTLYLAEIISGYPDGYFHPDDSLTRAQMAVIINKFIYAKSEVESGYYTPQKYTD